MVILITGQPGNGKTLTAFYALTKLLREDRTAYVVTNIKIYSGRLYSWFRGHSVKDAMERLLPLDNACATEFYRYPLDRKWETDKLGNVVPVSIHRPITYIIDEAHLFWNARNFQKTGTEVLSYVSQHRHLGDNIILITQHPEQIDKAFRRLVDEYWVMTNLEKRRIAGFKGPKGIFKKSVYFSTPSIMQRPAENERFKIDLEIANCYDTSAGKRFGEFAADTGQKKKGVPFTLALFCLGLAVVATMYVIGNVPRWAQYGVGKMFLGAQEKGAQVADSLVGGGAKALGFDSILLDTGTNMVQATNWGYVTIPVERKTMRTLNGRTVRGYEIVDEKVWTNLPPQSTTQPVTAPTVAAPPQQQQPFQPVANPSVFVPYRTVRLRMWDGTIRLIRIKTYERTESDYSDANGSPAGVDEETDRAYDDGL